MWSVGYFTDDIYYLPTIQVKGMPAKLQRGQDYISDAGLVRGARLEQRAEDREWIDEWKWADEEWIGRQDWNGLRVLMALINNWDLKDSNTGILRVRQPDGRWEYIYLVTDLGPSFGRSHLDVQRTKSSLKRYHKPTFIRQTSAETVDFATPGIPTALWLLMDPPHYCARRGMRWIGRDIPRHDARWMGQLLKQLSPLQIRDAFRAGGFAPDEVEGYTRVVEDRIEELSDL